MRRPLRTKVIFYESRSTPMVPLIPSKSGQNGEFEHEDGGCSRGGLLGLLGFSSAASATLLDFDLSCVSGQACDAIGGGTASFKLDQFPTPDHAQGDPFLFSFKAVPGTLNGQSVIFGIAFFELNPGPGGLALSLGTTPSLGGFGPQLFQGLVSSPELTAGEFPLRQLIGSQFYNFSLVVSPDNSLGSPVPVPEPATWAVMIASLGMMVGARWRSRLGKH